MKKFIALISCVFLLSQVFAAEIKSKNFVFSVGEESATLVKYTGTDAKVTIPKTVKKLPVTKIGKKAFSGNTTIKSVMINQTITEIGEEAFSNCPNLNNIYIKGQIDKIKIKKKCIS